MSTCPGSCDSSMLRAFACSITTTRGIVPQTPVELTVTDVESDHAGRPALEEHVGEAAGRGADVERLTTVDGNAEGIERVRQLDSATPDIWVVRLLEGDFRIFGDLSVPAFCTSCPLTRTTPDRRARRHARATRPGRDRQAVRRVELSIGSRDHPLGQIGQSAVPQAGAGQGAQRALVAFGGETARCLQSRRLTG